MLLSLVLLAQLHCATHVDGKVPPTPADFNAAEAKVFNVTARSFEFVFSPDVVINEGDSVTLNIRAADGAHGFFLESYMTESVSILKDQTVTVNFVASTPGTFAYACTVWCGIGHFSMGGELTVNARGDDPPSITTFTPKSGPVAGGTVVLITGTNFANETVVRFGNANALTTIVNSSTSITAFTPAHPDARVAVTVTNADGQSATSAEMFTFGTPRGRRRAVRR